MEWRVRKRDDGKWVAEKGIKTRQQPNPFGVGVVNDLFVVFETYVADSHFQAFMHAKKHKA